ncbi:MAG TPA: AAA family ATPase [Acidobacteriaceae bacterium]|nr:AAA family ATPase [Acidobacteriaceae bacterium]
MGGQIPIRIDLFGSLRFTFGTEVIAGVRTNRMRSLLAFLVLNRDAPQSREHIAFLLWPESDQAQARTNLRQLLHNLRRALPVECSLLSSDNASVRWLPDPSCTVDVFEFEEAIRRAERASQDEPQALRRALEHALALYQDDLLPDLFDDWLRPKREQLRLQFADALSRVAELLEAAGETTASIRHVARLIALDPLREAYYQTLMRLHLRNHDRSSALRVFHQCKRSLQRELGVSPAKATQDIFMEALKSEDALRSAVAVPPPMAPTKPLPLVGRRQEWDRLSECWRRVTQGESHVILITGEPGIGKTRLAEEFLVRCSQQSGQTTATARCYRVQGQLAYGPVTEWLRTEPLIHAREKLPRPQLSELARLVPEILTETPGLASPQPLTDMWQRHHLHDALTSTFRLAPKPLLLLIDDLQWCDQDSFEWLLSLFRSAPSDRLLVIGTVRAGDAGRTHPLAGLKQDLSLRGQLSEIAMEPLDADETAALAMQTATREIEPAVLHRLYEATKGNPLFVVESIRASLDEQLSERVPPRIQAVISARLAQLSAPAYELAGLAAAIGRSFTTELLAKATDWDEDSVSGALEELWRFRIIDGHDGVAYDYTHGILRDVAYAEVNPIRRRLLHRRIARALTEIYSPDFEPLSGWLAGHFEAAGMAEEAIRFYKEAASVAKLRFADAEAASLIRRALALCLGYPESARRDREELELLVTLGASLVKTDGYTMPEVGETYERGLTLSRRCDDRTHVFPLLSGSWAFHIVRGQVEDSRRVAQDFVDGARRHGASGQEGASHFLLGTSLFHLGKIQDSWKEMELAGSSSDGTPHPALALFAGPDIGVFRCAYLSHLHCLFGRSEEAVAKSHECIAVARQLSHPFTLAIALDYAAMFDALCGEATTAQDHAGEASAICRKFGFIYYLAVADILGGWARAMLGNAASGTAQMRLGFDALKSVGAELRLPFYHGLLAEACERAGKMGDALAHVATGMAFLNKNSEAWAAPELYRIQGDLFLRSGNPAQSGVSYRRAVDLSRQMGARHFERRASARLRTVSASAGEQEICVER